MKKWLALFNLLLEPIRMSLMKVPGGADDLLD